MCKDPTLIELFWLMHMLGNLAQNEIYILCFLALTSSLSKKRSRANGKADIYLRYKQIQHLNKNWNIARNIMCFIMNVIIAKIFFQPIYLLIFFKV